MPLPYKPNRNFLRRSFAPLPPKPDDGKTLVALVGMKHRGTESLVASFSAGELLELRREPDNAYDSNAVMVFGRGRHLGYVAGKQVGPIAVRMDADRDESGLAKPLACKLALHSGAWPLIEIAP